MACTERQFRASFTTSNSGYGECDLQKPVLIFDDVGTTGLIRVTINSTFQVIDREHDEVSVMLPFLQIMLRFQLNGE